MTDTFQTSAPGTAVAAPETDFSRAQPFQLEGSIEAPLGEPSLGEHLAFASSQVLLDFVATTAASVGLVDDNALEKFLKENTSKSYSTYFQNHKAGIQFTSAVAGALIPSVLAVKAIQGTSRIARLVEGVPGLSKVFVQSQKIAKLSTALKERELFLAARGQRVTNLDPIRLDIVKPLRNEAVFGKGLREAAAAELSIALTQNASDVLFPEEWEWYDYLPFIAGGTAVNLGLEAMVYRKTIRKVADASAKAAAAALNPGELNLTKFITRPGFHDIAVTNAAMQKAALESQKRQLGDIAESGIYLNALDAEITQIEGAQRTILQAQAGNVIPGGVSPKTVLSDAVVQSLVEATDRNPAALMWIKAYSEYGPTREFNQVFVQRRDIRVNQLRKTLDEIEIKARGEFTPEDATAMATAQKELKQLNELEPMVFKNGELVPLEEDFVRVSDGQMPLVEFGTDSGGVRQWAMNVTSPTTGKRKNVAVSEELDVFIGGALPEEDFATQWQKLDSFTRSGVYELFQRALDRRRALKDLKPIAVSKADSWVRLDAIDHGLRTNKLVESELQFAADMNVDEMRTMVLRGKYQALRKTTSGNENAVSGLQIDIPAGMTPSNSEIRYMLNMPGGEFGKQSPLEEFFSSRLLADADNLDEFTFKDIKEQLKLAQPTHEGLDFATGETLTTGRAFEPSTPGIFVWRLADKNPMVSRGFLDEALQTRHLEVREILLDGPLTGALVKRILQSDAYTEAQKVDMLTQQHLIGQGIITQGNFATRDSAVMSAVNAIQTMAEKEARTLSEAVYNLPAASGRGVIQDTFNRVLSRGNEASLFQVGQYMNARSAGWHLKAEVQSIGDGVPTGPGLRKAFTLEHEGEKGSANAARLKQLYGEELQAGMLMPASRADGRYMPLELNEDAFDVASAWQTLGDQLLTQQNTIFKAMGIDNVVRREWWAPPRNFANKEIAYLVDMTPQGDVIKKMVAGRTTRELEKLIADVRVDYAEALDSGQMRVLKQTDVEQFFLMRDRSFFEMVDVADIQVRRTQKATGASSDPLADSGEQVLRDGISAINKQINNLVRDNINLLFEGQLAYAQRAHRANPVPRTIDSAGRSIWEAYSDGLSGNRAIRRDGNLHKVYTAVEDVYDNTLLALWDRDVRISPSKIGTRLLKPLGIDLESRKFARMKGELGEHLPFENAVKMAESRFGVAPPGNMKQHMAAFNKLTSAVVLRWFEMAHPLLNLSGVVATMPAVIQALRQRPGEASEAWRGRIAAFGSIIPTENGGVPVLNPVRQMMSAVSYGFTKEGKAELAYASKQGYIRQEVAEIQRTLSDPQAAGPLRQQLRKIDNAIGFLSDKSEELSRSWAHLAGIQLARQHGIEGAVNKHIFAHRFANEVIGDYRASNRPQVFQGAVGLPLGLFQTYTWNYYQRLFSYIEARDVRAAATQFAMQASVFGATTMPGYTLFNQMFVQAQDGRSTPIDALQNAYGEAGADLIAFGSISSIPKIFGADGMALYTRGDVAPRVPTFINPLEAAPINFAKNVYEMLGKSVDQVLPGGQGFSVQRQMEILGTYLASRPLKGAFELAAGVSVDRRGNVIENDVRTGTSIAARVLGLRPLSETKQLDAWNRVKTTEISQYAKRTRLREGIKSAFRGNGLDSNALQDAFVTYIRTGGRPENFPNFIKQAYVNATTPKLQLKLQEALRGGKLQDALRLMNAQTATEE